jgi:apoptosis-inducing factor 2
VLQQGGYRLFLPDRLLDNGRVLRDRAVRVDATAELRLPGQRHVFAIGDIAGTPQAKQAAAAHAHAAVVAANIRTLLGGGDALTAYRPGPPGLVLPLDPRGGATYAPGWRSYLDADTVAQITHRATGDSERLLRLDILDAETTSRLKGA